MIFFSLQKIIVPSRGLTQCANKLRKKTTFKNKFKQIEVELVSDHAWPPVGEITPATHSFTNGFEAALVTR